jgi:Putative metallopeptidase/Cytochrome C oxidase, cbb3-type, subunit III
MRLRIYKFLSLVGLAATVFLSSSLKAQTTEELYRSNCLRCHASDGSGGTDLGKVIGVKRFDSTNASDWPRIIASGKGKMQGFGDKLTYNQIDSLVRYVRELTSIKNDSANTSTVPENVATSHVYVEPLQTLLDETISVKAGSAVEYNFPLMRKTQLNTVFQVSGGLNNEIRVMLLDTANYQRYAAKQPYSSFRGTYGMIRGAAQYNFIVPQTGLYYLLIDNGRAWLMPRTVSFQVNAVSPQKTAESLKIERTLEASYSELKRIFIFPDFQISICRCGTVNAFSNPDITICTELINELARKGLNGAIVFVLFHELGHTLMRGWGLPLYDNEDAADEFATVIMMLGNQQQAALEAAQWWASEDVKQTAVAKIWLDDRHSLSPQRARNVIRWLNNQHGLITRWQKLFIPNMQTAALQSLLNSPGDFDREAIRTELDHRGKTSASTQESR